MSRTCAIQGVPRHTRGSFCVYSGYDGDSQGKQRASDGQTSEWKERILRIIHNSYTCCSLINCGGECLKHSPNSKAQPQKGWAFFVPCSNVRDSYGELGSKTVKSDKTLKRYYNIINRKFFNNELPTRVCVRWLNEDEDDMRLEDKLFGFADKANDGYHKYQIALSKKLCGPASSRMTTLAHECIHVYLDLRDDHGEAFERARLMLSDRGIFRKGALVKGLTIF
jgi:hypothetical protein